ncbi:MAG: hypothetical protein WB992_19645 [Bryobacteraceae bacterium]
MRLAYKMLLRLYPEDHRALFASEMLSVFEEAAEERRTKGRAAFVWFAIVELIGLGIAIPLEWMKPSKPLPEESGLPVEVIEAQQHLERILSRMDYSIANHQFQKARFYSYAETKQRENLRRLREKYNIVE